jgi:hypothetical protein
MNFTILGSAQKTLESTSQNRHRLVEELHEKALQQQLSAAELRKTGDPAQAQTHGNIALKHASFRFGSLGFGRSATDLRGGFQHQSREKT